MSDLKYVFGPVPSRRLGNSLGIDIIPPKTCSYNCIYCQIGRTLHTRKERRSFVPVAAVIREIKTALRQKKRVDHITFSGSGEPTLNKDLGRMISRVKKITSVPVAVITNGSLLWQPGVRRDVAQADVVLPTMDFGDNAILRKMHRPVSGLTFRKIVNGLIDFRRAYAGQMWLEVFLVPGINTSRRELAKIKSLIRLIHPDKVHLNTAVRPPAERSVRPLTARELSAIRNFFGPRAEVIAEYHKKLKRTPGHSTRQMILDMLRRRPLSIPDMLAVLPIQKIALQRLLKLLEKEKSISIQIHNHTNYYIAL